MDPQLKEKWLIALRSGEYKQGRKRLKQMTFGETRHCCLGVLCEVMVKEGMLPGHIVITKGTIRVNNGVSKKDKEAYREESFEELSPIEWRIGLEEKDAAELMSMNDGCFDLPSWNFNEIADWIENNVK